MKVGDDYYVAFASGPTNYEGESGQKLRVFVLKLDGDFKIDGVEVIDTVKDGDNDVELNNAFSGRMFVLKENVSAGNPVYFGYVQQGSWKGGVLKLYPVTDGSGTTTWRLEFFMKDIGPVTARVVDVTVNGNKYVVFGEGRYFTGADDDPDGLRKAYSVKASCSPCSVDALVDVTDNPDGASASSDGWYVKLMAPTEDYTAERIITDPLVVPKGEKGMVVFTTAQPTSDPCGFSGRTRVFVGTVTGGGALESGEVGGKLFVQLSTGQVAEVTKVESRWSEFYSGTPSESPPNLVTPPASLSYEGTILYIKER